MIVCRRIKLSIERRVQLRSINATRLYGRVSRWKNATDAVLETIITNMYNLSLFRHSLPVFEFCNDCLIVLAWYTMKTLLSDAVNCHIKSNCKQQLLQYSIIISTTSVIIFIKYSHF